MSSIHFIKNILIKRKNESGFTLVEILVALIIISILAVVAIPFFVNQTRAAVEATLQSDVRNSAAVLFERKDFPTQEIFAQRSVTTDDNIVGMVVREEQGEDRWACVWGSHSFSDTDVVAYHFATDVMRLEEGFCEDEYPPIISTDEYPLPEEFPNIPPEIEEIIPEEPAAEEEGELTQQAGVNFIPHYYPQNNSVNFCWQVDVSAPEPVAWEYKLDLRKGPFWGTSHTTFTSQYNYYVKSFENGILTLTGTPGGWNEFVGGSYGNRSFGFCSQQTVEPPLNYNWFTTVVTPAASNSIWWACVDVRTTSTSIFPIPWRTEVDLKDYFTSIQGKTPQFTNLTKTDQGNQVYTVTGIGWNSYVSTTEPRTFSASICYDPKGQPW